MKGFFYYSRGRVIGWLIISSPLKKLSLALDLAVVTFNVESGNDINDKTAKSLTCLIL